MVWMQNGSSLARLDALPTIYSLGEISPNLRAHFGNNMEKLKRQKWYCYKLFSMVGQLNSKLILQKSIINSWYSLFIVFQLTHSPSFKTTCPTKTYIQIWIAMFFCININISNDVILIDEGVFIPMHEYKLSRLNEI